MNNPSLDEQSAWDNIMSADDQPTAYYLWCHTVLTAQTAGTITRTEAAGLICPRQEMAKKFGQLEDAADVQIVMDYASDIYNGARYVGAEDALEKDWRYVGEVVNRHI